MAFLSLFIVVCMCRDETHAHHQWNIHKIAAAFNWRMSKVCCAPLNANNGTRIDRKNVLWRAQWTMETATIDQPTNPLAGHCRLSELSNVASTSSNVFHSWNMYIYSHLAFTFCSTICVHASRLSWYCAAYRQPQNSTGISSALFSSRTDTYHILSNEWRETSNNTKNPYYSYWSRMNVSIDPAALSTLYNVHWLTHAVVAVNKYESQNDDWHRQHKTDT